MKRRGRWGRRRRGGRSRRGEERVGDRELKRKYLWEEKGREKEIWQRDREK